MTLQWRRLSLQFTRISFDKGAPDEALLFLRAADRYFFRLNLLTVFFDK